MGNFYTWLNGTVGQEKGAYMDEKDDKLFRVLGLAAMIAWPVYFIWRMLSSDD